MKDLQRNAGSILEKKYINDLEYQILICTSWVVMSDYTTTGHMEDNQTKH